MFINKFILLTPAEFDHWLDCISKLIKFLVAGELTEASINTFDILFSNEATDSVVLILLDLLHLVDNIGFHFIKVALHDVLL